MIMLNSIIALTLLLIVIVTSYKVTKSFNCDMNSYDSTTKVIKSPLFQKKSSAYIDTKCRQLIRTNNKAKVSTKGLKVRKQIYYKLVL